MSADPRAALNQLVAAFERHLEASSTRHGEDDPSVVAAYEDLADAFEAYDGALYDAYGEMTPLDIYTGDDGPDDEDDEEDDEDDEDADSSGTDTADTEPVDAASLDADSLDADSLDDHDDEDGDGAQLYAGLDDDLDFDDDEVDDDSGATRAR